MVTHPTRVSFRPSKRLHLLVYLCIWVLVSCVLCLFLQLSACTHAVCLLSRVITASQRGAASVLHCCLGLYQIWLYSKNQVLAWVCKFYFLEAYSWFTMLCEFLLYSIVTRLYILFHILSQYLLFEDTEYGSLCCSGRTLLFNRPIYNSLQLLLPNSLSIPLPPSSHLATTASMLSASVLRNLFFFTSVWHSYYHFKNLSGWQHFKVIGIFLSLIS